MSNKITSSFRGYFDEILGIYADNFENAQIQNARAYFLSHYHADHVQGLDSNELFYVLKKNNVKIYATELTSEIIKHNCPRLKDHVEALKMGTSTIILESVPERNLNELCLNVTLIPAGHCAGSTMFLFRTDTKKILFTGDFRINPNDLDKYKLLHDNNEPIKLDALYVDTTFLNSKFDFPKRTECVEMVVSRIKDWLKDDENAVALHTSAVYGYEFVFNEIYRLLDVKVSVGERWLFYSKISHLVPGVTNEPTRIHLCPNRKETTSHEHCTKFDYKYFYIHFSAYKWEGREGISPVEWRTPTRADVCFATHCSGREIKYFIDYFSPIPKIFGFPNIYNNNKRTINEIDSSVKKAKSDEKVEKDLLRKILG